jgi:hypothetical protein
VLLPWSSALLHSRMKEENVTYAKFTGALTIEPPLKADEVKALTAFFKSRRILTHGGPLDCRDLPGFHSQVIDMTRPAEGQPGVWCDLKVSEDGTTLSWDDESETTERNLDAWLTYVIDHLLKPGAEFDIRERDFDLSQMSDGNLLRSFTFDHFVNGEMTGTISEADGVWKIIVKDNEVSTAPVVLTLAAKDTSADEDA